MRTATPSQATVDSLIAEDLDAPHVVGNLGAFSEVAGEMLRIEARIADLSHMVELEQKELRRLREEVLPVMFAAAEVTSLTVTPPQDPEHRSYTCTVADAVYASISKTNVVPATDWLQKAGYGALVKHAYSIPIDKGDTAAVKAVRAALAKARIDYEEKLSVHPQTLVAFVRESLAAGRELPKTITYHVQPTATLKVRK